MRRTIPLHHAFESCWIWVGPAFVRVKAESHARHGRVAARAQDTEWVHAVKHPAAQSHRLKHQHAGVATCGEFGGDLGQRPLLDKSQRPGVFDVYHVFKLFDARDRATMDVVADDGAILEEVAQTEKQVLRE